MAQGVTRRWNTQRFCEPIGLTGYIKNEPNGTVTLIAEGDTAKLKALVEWLKGQPISQANITITRQIRRTATGQFHQFKIIW